MLSLFFFLFFLKNYFCLLTNCIMFLCERGRVAGADDARYKLLTVVAVTRVASLVCAECYDEIFGEITC